MTVIVEYVILDNFLMDLFIGILVCDILLRKYRYAFISATIGTILALLYPTISLDFQVLYKVLALLCSSMPFITKSLYDWLKSTLIYAIIAFIYNGVISLVFNSTSGFIVNTDGLKVATISTCCIVGYFIIKIFIKFTQNKLLKKDLLKISCSVNGKSIKAVGFVDSGNMAVAGDGKGVIFLDKVISKKIDLKGNEYIVIDTMGGSKLCEIIKIDEVMIYFGKRKHIYKNVNAVKTNQIYDGFQVLLSNNLKEIK